MTLLVVLGFVLIATILAALYLSLRSARGGEREPARGAGAASARARQASGGSRSERSPSMSGRLRGLAGRDKNARTQGRRASHDADDWQDSRDYESPRMRGGADGAGRNGLVAATGGRGGARRGAIGLPPGPPA